VSLAIQHPPDRARDPDFEQLTIIKPAQGIDGLARVSATSNVSADCGNPHDEAEPGSAEELRKQCREPNARNLVMSFAARGHADLACFRLRAGATAGLQAGAQALLSRPQQFSVKYATRPFMAAKSAA